ncbi:MAG: hypothetical protein RSA02_06935, partial [Bacteroidales bacterium]
STLIKTKGISPKVYSEDLLSHAFHDPALNLKDPKARQKRIEEVNQLMKEAAKKLNFIKADQYLEELNYLNKTS